MKLIVIVQRIDKSDDNLSFFHRWLEKFSEKLEKVFVAGMWTGEHHLPKNVEVFSLGKERGYFKIRQFFRLQKFLLRHLKEVDGIYVHMGSIFAILSFPLAKLFRKKIVLWYAHGAVPWKLKLAEKLVDVIATSSFSGCRLASQKIKVLGQGIDVELFRHNPNTANRYPNDANFNILYAARLVPVKNHKTLIEAVNILINQKNIKNIRLKIMGRPLLKSQEKYLEGLKSLVRSYNLEECVEFVNGVAYSEMPQFYQETDLFVNPSSTGSLDKVVLEAMAAGCFVLNCNEAYNDILADKYLFKKGNVEDLSEKIIGLMNSPQDPHLREIVVKNHNLDILILKIINQFHV